MGEEHKGPVPVEIKRHQASRILDVTFDDGKAFSLPCEYLHVFSPAADVRVARDAVQIVIGKENLCISVITPVGDYAVQLVFDDDHDTGIYAWNTLYELGENKEQNWQSYLQELESRGITRNVEANTGKRQIKLLYFASLATYLRKETDELDQPAEVQTVDDMLAMLRKKGMLYQQALDSYTIKDTVNKQFLCCNN